MRTRFHATLWTVLLVLPTASAVTGPVEMPRGAQLVEKVNPFVGTAAHGHTFPGVALPFGMVQLSPDTGNAGWDWCSGYHYKDNSIMGFSHTHLSGTGCADLGDFLFMPTTGPLKFEPGSKENPDEGYRSRFSHDREIASPGFYQVFLADYEIDVQLTATRRVGFHQYTYPATKAANVIVDITHSIGDTKIQEGSLEIVGEREIRGYVRKSGWSPDRVLYFVARFSRPFAASGLVIDGLLNEDVKQAKGKNLKAYVQFDTSQDRQVLVKVAISAVSSDGAAKNLDAECPGWDFSQVRSSASAAWENQLAKITVQGGSEEAQRTFYTALYHTCLAPYLFCDADGSYRGMDQQIHQAQDFENYTVFSLWDTFRATHPLFTLIEQRRTNDFIKALLCKYEQKGILPFWELASGETWCMIGYHSIPVIADAWVKGIRGYDGEQALEAMKKSAMQDHQGLKFYKELGYVPMDKESYSASRTVEYAYDDWCIGVMAKELGRSKDEKTFAERSLNYRKLFDTSIGFVRGKDVEGNWNAEFDPDRISAQGTGEFIEGNAWHYTWFAPQDVPGLISAMGGKQPFIDKLDQLFSRPGYEHADVTGLIGQYAHGNEPCHNYAYLYTFVGEHWKTQQRVAEILHTMYSDQPDGLCGNEDCGQMSAWYVLSAMGFYPFCPGQPVYVFGSPQFPRVSIQLENGNNFQVIAENVSERNLFIQSATLNGKPYNKSYLQHRDILAGGRLVFHMGPSPNKQWAQNKTDLPE
jgi:predicted alpha-1,2-mannosidase